MRMHRYTGWSVFAHTVRCIFWSYNTTLNWCCIKVIGSQYENWHINNDTTSYYCSDVDSTSFWLCVPSRKAYGSKEACIPVWYEYVCPGCRILSMTLIRLHVCSLPLLTVASRYTNCFCASVQKLFKMCPDKTCYKKFTDCTCPDQHVRSLTGSNAVFFSTTTGYCILVNSWNCAYLKLTYLMP